MHKRDAIFAGFATAALCAVALLTPRPADACVDLGTCEAPPVIEPSFEITQGQDCFSVEILRDLPHGDAFRFRVDNQCAAKLRILESDQDPLFFDNDCSKENRRYTLATDTSAQLGVYGHKHCPISSPKSPGDYSKTIELQVGELLTKLKYSYTVPDDSQKTVWRNENCVQSSCERDVGIPDDTGSDDDGDTGVEDDAGDDSDGSDGDDSDEDDGEEADALADTADGGQPEVDDIESGCSSTTDGAPAPAWPLALLAIFFASAGFRRQKRRR